MCKDRDWILTALAHKEPDAVPYNFSFTPLARKKLEEHYGRDDLAEALALPIRTRSMASIKPRYGDPARPGETVKDEFGVLWSMNSRDRGSPVGPCLAEPDLRHYTFPDPGEAYRFEGMGEWCETNREHYTIVWVGDLWERATFMRGMENMLMDLALNPTFVEALLSDLCDYILQTMRILFERFEFDGIAISDDYGMQDSLIMSPAQWRGLIKPRLSEIYSLAHKHGRSVLHHTCGNNHPIIADFVDLGLDILHPIQPEAMDIFKLKEEFGRELTFCGGIGTQDLLPRGSAGQVREEVRKLKDRMGRGGGYILEPGITLQADVPLDNIVAMLEEAQDRGA